MLLVYVAHALVRAVSRLVSTPFGNEQAGRASTRVSMRHAGGVRHEDAIGEFQRETAAIEYHQGLCTNQK
jgi:hypothetical protein